MHDIMNNGLTMIQVQEHEKKYGKNTLTCQKKNSFIKIFISSLGDPIIRILIIALAIKIIFLIKDFDWYETIGIVIAIFLASFISSISEFGSEKAFQKMQEEAEKINCKVKRNGKINEIEIDNIVFNDLVILEAGDKVPSDGILIKGELYANESMLTGETEEIKKIATDDFNNSKKENRLYRGTIITEGYGEMITTNIGDSTIYGKINQELQIKSPNSPLKIRLQNLAKIISKIGYISAVLVSISYLFAEIIIKNNFNIENIINTIKNIPLMISYILYALTLCVTVIVVAIPDDLFHL